VEGELELKGMPIRSAITDCQKLVEGQLDGLPLGLALIEGEFDRLPLGSALSGAVLKLLREGWPHVEGELERDNPIRSVITDR
jgi:hypothetical protein